MKKFFTSLFGLGNRVKVDAITQPIAPSTLSLAAEPVTTPVDPPQLSVGCAQSAGKQREHNEDALFTLTTTLTSEQNYTPFGLFIVADGMGGHQHGEIASGIAIRSMANYIVRKLYTPLLSFKPATPDESLQEIMQEGVQDAHRTIIRQVPGGGTTMTALLILGSQLIIAHVGDSRAYWISPNGHLETLTRDHSLVKRLVELGQITTDEAAVHPQRNVLYRALGQGEPFDPDISSIKTPPAGHLMVCSDGLWNVVPESEIHRIVNSSSNLEKACQTLIKAANEAGGPDNITVILIRLPD